MKSLYGPLTRPNLKKLVAADGAAGVTGYTALLDKGLHTADFLGAHGLGVTLEPGVKARRGQQGALESSNGVGDVVVGQRSLFTREGLLELGLVFRDRGDALDGKAFVRNGHFHRVHDRTLGLFFGILGTAVPEVRLEQGGVHHGRGVTATEHALVPHRGRQVVDTIGGQVVTGVTADRAPLRKTCVEIQLFAKCHLGRVELVGGVVVCRGGQGCKHGAGSCEGRIVGGDCQQRQGKRCSGHSQSNLTIHDCLFL